MKNKRKKLTARHPDKPKGKQFKSPKTDLAQEIREQRAWVGYMKVHKQQGSLWQS